MRLKKAGIVAVALALVVFAMGALTACSPSPDAAIRDAITDEFDTFKNKDDSAIEQIAKSAEAQGIDQYGIENEQFADMVLDGFDYHINSVEVDGNSASANITISSKSAAAFKDKLTAAIADISANPDLASMSNDEKMELISQAITDSFKDIEIVNENVTIEYSNVNGTWTPTNSGTALGSLDSVVFAQSI